MKPTTHRRIAEAAAIIATVAALMALFLAAVMLARLT